MRFRGVLRFVMVLSTTVSAACLNEDFDGRCDNHPCDDATADGTVPDTISTETASDGMPDMTVADDGTDSGIADTGIDTLTDSAMDSAFSDADSTVTDSSDADADADATPDSDAADSADTTVDSAGDTGGGGGDTNGSATDTASTDSETGSPLKCPAGKASGGKGSEMVLITEASTPFCIDKTEVTVEQYNEYRGTSSTDPPIPDTFPSLCKTGMPYTPVQDLDASHANKPRSGVSWCYAAAYCQWAGKRLCGAIGGTNKPGEGTTPIDPKNEWYFACKNGPKGTTYSYGSTYVASTCATDADAGVQDVASKTACHGTAAPYDGIFDMSGNLAEWDNRVDTSNGASARGGSFYSGSSSECSEYPGGLITGFSGDDTGIRCCADAKN